MAALGDLPSLAAAVSADLAAAGIPHAVSGAAAMALHGYVRATRDLDLLVVVPQVRLPEVLAVVRRHGFSGEDADLLRSLSTKFFAEMTSGPLSVEIFVPAIPYHRRVLERAVRKDAGGRSLPVVSLEDLVVLKALWHRAKDVADVQALVASAGSAMDPAYVRRTLADLLPPEDARHAWLAGVLSRFGPGGA